jgi:hypothetical protein
MREICQYLHHQNQDACGARVNKPPAPGAGEILTSAIKRKLSSKAGLHTHASRDEPRSPVIADKCSALVIRFAYGLGENNHMRDFVCNAHRALACGLDLFQVYGEIVHLGFL